MLTMLAALALAGCGGGSSSPSPTTTTTTTTATPTPTPTPTTTAGVANVTAVTFDAGPTALANGHQAFNSPFVTITICAPGSTTNCQTIDHVIVDTGSVGLRILQPVLNAALLAALPVETDPAGNPVGECYQYILSYAFGSVRQADFKIAGETVAGMPFQTIADTGAFATVPAKCSSGGGTPITTVNDFDANGVLGIGTTTTDCGTICAGAGSSGASYYDCPDSGCDQIIARAIATVAPFQQLPNPVAAFASDNNGTMLTLPTVPRAGLAALSGTLTFGIGTQSDNSLTAMTLLTVTTSQSNRGPGLFTATYNSKAFTQSYLDTGSNAYFFEDSSLALCTQSSLHGFYCPAGPISLSPTLTGENGITVIDAFTLYNPNDVTGNAIVAPGLGINGQVAFMTQVFNNSFGFGIPFYFGRTVFTAIEGVNAGGTIGPYVAF